MKIRTLTLIAAILYISANIFAQTKMTSYKDKDGFIHVLKWETETGVSTLYGYWSKDNAGYSFNKKDVQLPQSPLGKGNYGMLPFIDKDGFLHVLVWDENTGRSILYGYWNKDNAGYSFNKKDAQLPQSPLGEGKHTMTSYIDKDGFLHVLIWNEVSGKSILYGYWKKNGQNYSFNKKDAQLPNY